MGPKYTLRLMRTLGSSLASLAQSSSSLLSNALGGRIASPWMHATTPSVVYLPPSWIRLSSFRCPPSLLHQALRPLPGQTALSPFHVGIDGFVHNISPTLGFSTPLHSCHNLPFGGVTKKASRAGQGCVFHRRKTRGVATNVYLRKTLEKSKDDGLCILKMRIRELFLCTGKVLAPHTFVTRDISL